MIESNDDKEDGPKKFHEMGLDDRLLKVIFVCIFLLYEALYGFTCRHEKHSCN